jgi:DNA-binding transcriptional MerR regulator
VKEKGVSVGDMQAKLLAKVEELTLHMIQADERNSRLEQQNQELRDRLARLEKSAASVTTTAAK